MKIRDIPDRLLLSLGLTITKPRETTSGAGRLRALGPRVGSSVNRPKEDHRVSIYACDVHGSRIRGPLDAIYLTLLQGGRRDSRRLRVCPNDHAELLAKYTKEWTLAGDEGPSEGFVLCSACGEQPERPSDLVTFFATSYRKGTEPDEYYAAYCGSCAEDFRLTFALKPS